MGKNRFLISLILGLVIIQSCISPDIPHTQLAPGPWRAVLNLAPKLEVQKDPDAIARNLQIEEVTDNELPFNFEVIYDGRDDFHIELINGSERIQVPSENITYGIDLKTNQDTLFIDFPVYDAHIQAFVEDGIMEGTYHLRNKDDYQIPFVARHGEDHRFTRLKKPAAEDLTGKWEVQFAVDTEDQYPAIGEFVQEGNKLTGTFITETGDYRYLEGTVQANKAYLSCFDGTHLFMFEAKIQEDGSLIGSFRSGNHYQNIWHAVRNEDFSLTDPTALTYIENGSDQINFSFQNEKGETVSLSDERYRDKVVLVQIFGTWCPNCRDETQFLTDYLKAHPEKEIEVIGLAFERHKEIAKAHKALSNYKTHFGMDYELLLAGHSNKTEALKSLPMLNKIISYPTLIFIDKNKKVRNIHTGFYGPATSAYEDFKIEFEEMLSNLLEE